jgi:hypothetical protein
MPGSRGDDIGEIVGSFRATMPAKLITSLPTEPHA